MIELRSDTFTLPTTEMMEAISMASLGDDVYGEDLTVRRLEALAASKFGKEAACLMPSGTMANLTSILAHCTRGSKVLMGKETDIYKYEAGGASVCGGIMYEPIPNQPDGRLLISDLEKAFPDDNTDPQFALPALICLENTHTLCGGVVLTIKYLKEVQDFAHSKAVPLHMDGARIFNAAVAMKVHPAEIAKYADSVQFCLSKGLSAPIGSVVVGDQAFITKVHRMRKMLGGGMRQAGIIAAAGIVALETMVDRLDEDHANALRLAKGLAEIPGIKIDLTRVQTNIVIFSIVEEDYSYKTFLNLLSEKGLNMMDAGQGRIRAVTHYGITEKDIDNSLEIISTLLRAKEVK